MDAFAATDLAQRIQNACEKHFEMPFALKENDTVVYGVMDVVFREEDGWTIIDFKTDDFEQNSELKKIYEAQLSQYAAYWQKITGEAVIEKLLVKI